MELHMHWSGKMTCWEILIVCAMGVANTEKKRGTFFQEISENSFWRESHQCTDEDAW